MTPDRQSSMRQLPDYLTEPEVATMLRKSTKTIRRYCDNGCQPRLRSIQLPGGRIFKREDVNDFISRRSV